MKIMTKASTMALLTITTINTANANIYIGAKASTFTDESLKIATINITSESKLGYGLFAGLKMDNNFGLEVDYTEDGTILDIPGDIAVSTLYTIFNSKKARVTDRYQYGAYTTYHFSPSNQSDLFIKGKLGYVHGVVEVNDDKAFRENGFGGGIGLGYRLSNSGFIELSYDHSNLENTQSKLGLGLAYVF